jgi:hypothetical protein
MCRSDHEETYDALRGATRSLIESISSSTATAGAEMDLVAWRRKRQFFFCARIPQLPFKQGDKLLVERQK